MTFTLPDLRRLSPDQDDVLALPLDASALVVGPPGTGKTLMALYRARQLHNAGRPTQLLMYGRLLSSYTQAAIDTLRIGSLVDTFHHWFPDFWSRTYGSKPPKTSTWTFDWAECIRIIGTRPVPTGQKRNIIVDEGQDLPRDFYHVLQLVARSMLIFSDENQRITDHQSTSEDILTRTGIGRTLTLTRNRRNTAAIARFAAHFHVGSPSRTARPPRTTSRDRHPVLIHHPTLHGAVDHIAGYEQAHPDETIGILLPTTIRIRRFHDQLKARTHNPVQLYVNKDQRRRNDPIVDPSTPGIKLITWVSCKGLEFDSVFLPELQAVPGDPEDDGLRMKLYVACTRARRTLTLMYTGDGEPTLVKSLPPLLNDLRGRVHVE